MSGLTSHSEIINAGYESPCGVMSFAPSLTGVQSTWLRIPMRGYEFVGPMAIPSNLVPLRIPMRGYEYALGLAGAYSARVTNPHAGL